MKFRLSLVFVLAGFVANACSSSNNDDGSGGGGGSDGSGGGGGGSGGSAAGSGGSGGSAAGTGGAGGTASGGTAGGTASGGMAGATASGGNSGSGGASAMGGAGGMATGMSFFVTSANPGQGGNLNGIDGADAHCKMLATAVGAGNRTWRAYLSTNTEDAKMRIGTGPWVNQKGVQIASSVEDLHSANNKINKMNALDEKGMPVNGRGDMPNRHDIITGTNADGTRAMNKNCGNWTSAMQGTAVVGHHDRMGQNDSEAAKSWNSSHDSSGCSLMAFRGSGGEGLFYCFAAN